MNKFHTISIVCILLLASCNSHKKDEAIVIFPNSLQEYCYNDTIEQDSYYNENRYKLLAYFDSLGCFECKINEMIAWSGMIDYFATNHSNCKIIFILSPSVQDFENTFNYVKSYDFDYPIYLDYCNEFYIIKNIEVKVYYLTRMIKSF